LPLLLARTKESEPELPSIWQPKDVGCNQLFIEPGSGRARGWRDHPQGWQSDCPASRHIQTGRYRAVLRSDQESIRLARHSPHNAGVYEFGPLESVTEKAFRRLFDLNVSGLILTSQQAAKHFGPEGGTIVNVSSLARQLAPAYGAIYSATKAAVDAVTKSLAKELGRRESFVSTPSILE